MKSSPNQRRSILAGAGFVLVASVWLFRGTFREQIRNRATLANDAPPPEVVADMIEQASDRPRALLAAWNSGKIMQRETAIREVMVLFPGMQPLPVDIESVVLAGALDPDTNVRENALGILQARHDPALAALAAAQLGDVDSGTRMLGLNHLGTVPARVGVPLAAGLLDDPDLRVVGESVKLLGGWSGQEFGVKLADAVPSENRQSGLLEFSAIGEGRIRAAAAKARTWWGAHKLDFPLAPGAAPVAAGPLPMVLRAKDFQLRTLAGDVVRLSDFRGQVVLVNFWTTWCTACVSEMPELVALQKEHAKQLVILGVSLDLVPDDDGDHPVDPPAVRQKVARAIQERGINYPVLLDARNDAGGYYNGGELPTTVIVDAEGNIRRRFVGARTLKEFEQMVAEAARNHSGRTLAGRRCIPKLLDAVRPQAILERGCVPPGGTSRSA